jgi:hypothetical protein
MALLRQCLQELRLRRGETDLPWEGPQGVSAHCRVAAPIGLRQHDDAYAERAGARSDGLVVRASRALVADPAWQ